MKLKSPTIDVPPESPFKNDVLDREPYAATLSEFLRSLEDPFVLALEGGWGHGKSTFIRMWSQGLRNERHACIYFNAWQADFMGDPLIPLLSEVVNVLQAGGSSSQEVKKQAIKLKDVGLQVAKRALPVAAKLITAGVLDLEDFSEKAYAEAVEKLVKEKFDDYDAHRHSLETFRKSLTELVSQLEADGSALPVVFFVDELDRCKPPFAIALLERLKHLFNIPNVVFVLAIDKAQLEESVKGIYGQGCEAGRYLKRFIDVEYALPEPNREAFARHLTRLHGLDVAFPRVTGDSYADKQFVETFTMASQVYDLRLRDQEQALSLLAIAWRTLRPGENVNPFIAALLIALKVSDAESYKQLVAGNLAIRDVLNRIRSNRIGAEFLDGNYGLALEAFLVSYAGTQAERNKWAADLHNASHAPGASEHDIERASRMRNILLNPPGGRRAAFDKLARRLAIAEHFTIA